MFRNYYANRLNNIEYSAYSRLMTAIQSRDSRCKFYGLTADAVKKIVKVALYDNPREYYAFLHMVRISSGGGEVNADLYYLNCDNSLFYEKLNAIVTEIANKLKPNTTDYDICKLAYDYLCTNVKGDSQALNDFNNIQNQKNEQEIYDYVEKYGKSFTAYGALVDQKAVCMGLAMAYKLILDEFSIECACVPGTYNGTPHMINIVKCDNQVGFVDVSEGLVYDELKMIRYHSFLMTKEVALKYFTFEEDFSADSHIRNYFVRNKLLFKNLKDLRRYLENYIFISTNGEIRFFYDSKAVSDEYLQKVLGKAIEDHLGHLYTIKDYYVANGFGNCLIEKSK